MAFPRSRYLSQVNAFRWGKARHEGSGCRVGTSLDLTGIRWCRRVGLLPRCVAVLLLLTCTPVMTITLPVTMPVSHPSDFLSVSGAEERVGEGSSASHLSPMDIDKVREEEVMYHLYKNGRLGASYQRKASTVFLVELFNNLVQGLPPAPSGGRGQKKAHHQGSEELSQTNTIRTFSAGELTSSPKDKITVHFPLPYLPPKERLGSAELRFLHSNPSARSRSRSRSRSRYKLALAVCRGGRVMQRLVLRERALLQRKYQVFDVSRALEKWINTAHGNITLQVRLPRRLQDSLQLNNASLASISFIALYLQDRDFLKNMYHSYTTDDVQVHNNRIPEIGDKVSGHSDPQNAPSRKKRDSDASSRDKRGFSRRKSRNRKNRRWYRAPKNSQCRMYDFKVDFDLIGWGQWIIHPKDFNSKFCYGACPSPVDSKYNPTNHAMLQTLMRQKKRRLAPPTCCVPTRLKPLSMLYFEYGEIVVRHHEDMIADECGCR